MRHGSILRSIGLVVGFIALQIVAWIPLRARAEDLGTRRYSDGLEQLVFRTSPTLWLQEQLAPLPANGLSMMTAVIHASWFFVPWIVVIAIMANMVSKTALAGILGGGRLFWLMLALFALPMLGGVAMLLLW
jgi:ABC-type multidrug transport system permease subunit